jgi:glucose-6-phosphate isomerase
MNKLTRKHWKQFQQHHWSDAKLGLALDFSRMGFQERFLTRMERAMGKAYLANKKLEAGAIANPSENRMVGHYWLRTPQLAPQPELRKQIKDAVALVKRFAAEVHAGVTRPPRAERFTQVLSIGIGGSALGPMFVSDALGDPLADKLALHFLDNTDPDGMERVLRRLGGKLAETLVIVTSKSGDTPEPRNGLLVVRAAFQAAGLDFARQAVAVTSAGSKLDDQARTQNWVGRFPMWDWVGGRTSVTSAVGLLPAALQGFDIDALLQGAADCDAVTRVPDTRNNPAALLALMWFYATDGAGKKDMVILPYKDRLLLFSRYLQQLIMESLGKERDLNRKKVHQGITVYGNKGSTDQHAYVQQLRDGVPNFFVTFIRVLEDGGPRVLVPPGVGPGDYLDGFLLGTRQALAENGRQSLTLTIPRVDAYRLGVLIALFERAVTFYATLVNINAFDQPGVQAGKRAAGMVLALQHRILTALPEKKDDALTAEEIATAIGSSEEVESVCLILEHLAANGNATVAVPGKPWAAKYSQA